MASSASHFGRWNSCVQRQGDTTMTEVIRPGCEWRVRQGRGQCDAASPLPDPSVAALAQDGAASASKEPSVGGDPEAIDMCAKVGGRDQRRYDVTCGPDKRRFTARWSSAPGRCRCR